MVFLVKLLQDQLNKIVVNIRVPRNMDLPERFKKDVTRVKGDERVYTGPEVLLDVNNIRVFKYTKVDTTVYKHGILNPFILIINSIHRFSYKR